MATGAQIQYSVTNIVNYIEEEKQICFLKSLFNNTTLQCYVCGGGGGRIAEDLSLVDAKENSIIFSSTDLQLPLCSKKE